jgi:hypothetical protein
MAGLRFMENPDVWNPEASISLVAEMSIHCEVPRTIKGEISNDQ